MMHIKLVSTIVLWYSICILIIYRLLLIILQMRLLNFMLVTVLLISVYQCKEVDEVDIDVAKDDSVSI